MNEPAPRAETADWAPKKQLLFILPYLLCLASQLPLLFLYGRNLWTYPHYQFFPFVILAVGFLLYMRWPRADVNLPFRRSGLSTALLVGALLFGGLATAFLEPFFAACSLVLTVFSLALRVHDSVSKGSLVAIAIPLVVIIQPPLNVDGRLITQLQRTSARICSYGLDFFGYLHELDGTQLVFPDKKFGVEEACSGVQSFFTLLASTAIFVVLARRPWLRATLLLVAAVFWALLMNTVRIFAIPVAYVSLQIDLSDGLAHDILGYSALIIAFILVASTDQLLLFIFGPVALDELGSPTSESRITRFWNRIVAGIRRRGPNTRRQSNQHFAEVSHTRKLWIGNLGIAVVMLVFGLIQMVDVGRTLARPEHRIRFFDMDVTVPLEEDSLPQQLASWERVSYETAQRERGSDFGEYSDIWQYRAPNCQAIVSLDQPFPGWHELTVCYTSDGWSVVDRVKKTPPTEADSAPWSYIEVTFKQKTGEHGYLLFSHFDIAGKPFDAPDDWGQLNSFLIRLKNRLSHRIRERLFQSQAYQAQVFVRSLQPLNEAQKNEITERYLHVRELLRKDVQRRGQQAEKETP